MRGYEVRLLGAFELRFEGELISGLEKARPRGLLAYLLLHRDEELTRHGLAALFWPDSAEGQARTNLRNLLHRIRRALPDADALLEIDAATVRVRTDAELRVDVHELEQVVERIEAAEDEDSDAHLELLERASALYRGELLPDCRDEWIFGLRERLARMATEVADDLARHFERRRDHRAAIRVAREALGHDPLSETMHRRLIRLLAADGDRAGALRAYHACAEVLARDLDTEPSKATEELVARLRAADVERTTPTHDVPLAGRAEEWTLLTGAVDGLSRGSAHVVLLEGDAGIGKTRLADELCRWARRQGIATASASCYEAEGRLAYAPVCEWLRSDALRSRLDTLDDARASELSRILPELRERRPSLAAPGPLDQGWQRQRFLEAITNTIRGADQALVLHLDDVQWTDTWTLEWLHHLLRRAPDGAPLLVLITERIGESADEDALRQLERAIGRDGSWTSVRLSPLGPEDAAQLAHSLVSGELSEAQAARLYDESEGNPLFLVELARGGVVGPTEEGSERRLPERLRAVIGDRLGLLSTSARDLVRVAAIVGRRLDWEVLVRASDLPETEAVDALDELWGRGVLRERGAGEYDFSHHKIREVAAEELPPGRRRSVHRSVADALEQVHAHRLDAVWSRVAFHREAAAQSAEAIDAHRKAAEIARRVYANDDAIGHLRRAVALLASADASATRTDAVGKLAELLERTGRPEEARATVESALEASNNAPLDLARLRRRIATSWIAQHRHVDALSCLDEAEQHLVDLDDATLAHRREWLGIQLDRMSASYWLGRWEAMAELVERVRPTIDSHGSPTQRTIFRLSTLNMVNRRDRYASGAEASAHVTEALAAARDTGDRLLTGETNFMAGFVALGGSDFSGAAEPMRRAIAIAEEITNPWLELRAVTYLAFHARRTHDASLHELVERSERVAEQLEMPTYVGTAHAHKACMALRAEDADLARTYALEAVELWSRSALAYPFQWSARLVLLALHVDAGFPADETGAIEAHVQTLLDDGQQQLGDEIEAALARFESAEGDAGARALRDAVEAARTLAYI